MTETFINRTETFMNRVALLRIAGVEPQADGLIPIVLTREEMEEMLAEQAFKIVCMGLDERISPSGHVHYHASYALGAAIYVLEPAKVLA